MAYSAYLLIYSESFDLLEKYLILGKRCS